MIRCKLVKVWCDGYIDPSEPVTIGLVRTVGWEDVAVEVRNCDEIYCRTFPTEEIAKAEARIIVSDVDFARYTGGNER